MTTIPLTTSRVDGGLTFHSSMSAAASTTALGDGSSLEVTDAIDAINRWSTARTIAPLPLSAVSRTASGDRASSRNSRGNAPAAAAKMLFAPVATRANSNCLREISDSYESEFGASRRVRNGMALNA